MNPLQLGLKIQYWRNEDNCYVDCPIEKHSRKHTTNYCSSTGRLYCYACRRALSIEDIVLLTGVEPDTYTFSYGKKKSLPEQNVNQIYSCFDDNDSSYLIDHRLILDKTKNEYKIKCNTNAVLIPIYDEDNIRSLIQRNISGKIRYIQYGEQPICFPHEIKEDKIFLVEGIFTCLRLRQIGIENVYANVGTYLNIRKFATYYGKDISVFFDDDTAGNTAAQDLYENLPNVKVRNKYKDYDLRSDIDLMEIFSL